METQKLSNVIHGTINQLIDENVIAVNRDYTIEHTLNLKANTVEEHQALDTLHNLGKTNYPTLLRQLLTKPIFGNVANCMNALKSIIQNQSHLGSYFIPILPFLL